MSPFVTRSDLTVPADPSRVLARLFLPGHELLKDRDSRAPGVLSRTLGLDEDDAAAVLARVRARYAARHRDFEGVLREHYEQIAHRVPEDADLDEDRRALVGASFTQEFAIEGAALFNPSCVPHPDQSGLEAGQVRFVMSLRAVGEGHLSCIELRTGVLGPGRRLHLDDPGPHAETGRVAPTMHDRDVFAARLAEAGADAETASFLARRLSPRFDDARLERALADLVGHPVARGGGARTAEIARRTARCTYEVLFDDASSIAERVLWPEGPSESRGMEDARFVRFVEPGGAVVYRATYTAYDGEQIAPQVIETASFRRFRVSQLAGPAARDKGMALFPRHVGGRQLALTRSDRVTVGIASSADGRTWADPVTLHGPSQPWEIVQTGNCGSPVETSAGWVVLTHGVGPMREYAIGALLLDLEDPTRVLGALREPLVVPAEDEREGYVPNVVYSCGPLLNGDVLLVPYGASDDSVRFAFVDVPALLERLLADGASPAYASAAVASAAPGGGSPAVPAPSTRRAKSPA